jgi:hypothetical protein
MTSKIASRPAGGACDQHSSHARQGRGQSVTSHQERSCHRNRISLDSCT